MTTVTDIFDDQQLWAKDEEPDCESELCTFCNLRMPVNMMTALFGAHLDCLKREAGNNDND